MHAFASRLLIASLLAIGASCLGKRSLSGRGGSAAATSLRRRRVVSQGQQTRFVQDISGREPFNLTLVITLSYLNDTIASGLESRDPSNELVSHFCMAVNSQAGGSQVEAAAKQAGVDIETQVNMSSDGSADYQCMIRSTSRATDNVAFEIFGKGYFILEVKVTQTVYVIPAGSLLSRGDVYELVLNGFNEANGGRLTFRSLLRQDPQFSTVLSVETLDASSPVPSTAFPTVGQTQRPTQEPRRETDKPSSLPSVAPTPHPTAAQETPTITTDDPTMTPTVSPTQPAPVPSIEPTDALPNMPSASPAVLASGSPSSAPSARRTRLPSASMPTSSPTNADQQLDTSTSTVDRVPLIVGAVVGAAACILASCFFIFCIGFPICKRASTGECIGRDDVASNVVSGGHCHPVSWTSAGRQALQGPSGIVPNEVELDADNESLADTTLGDVTTGGGGEMQKHQDQKSARTKPNMKSSQPETRKEDETKMQESLTSGSFDENSVYTSNLETKVVDAKTPPPSHSVFPKLSSMLLPPPLSRTLEYDEDIVFPLSDHVKEPSLGSLMKLGLLARNNKRSAIGSNTSRSSFGAPEVVNSDEDRAIEVAKHIDAGTKGFDPFHEEDISESSGASFDGETEGLNSTRQTYSPELDERASPAPSSISSHTRRVRNQFLMAASSGDLLEPVHDEEKREVDNIESLDYPSATLDELLLGAGLSRDVKQASPAASGRSDNNTLLRSVLEDAHRLSRETGYSSRSRQSAPPRLNERVGGDVSTADDTNGHDLESFLRKSVQDETRHQSSSMSVPSTCSRQHQSPPLDGLGLPGNPMDKSGDRYVTPPSRNRYFDRGVVSEKNFSYPPKPPQAEPRAKLGSFLTSSVTPDLKTPVSASESEDGVSRGSAVFSPHHFVHPPRALNVKTQETPLGRFLTTPTSSQSLRQSALASSPADGTGTLGADRRDSRIDRLISAHPMPDTPISSPGVLGIKVKPKGKESAGDDASSDSEGLSDPWLFEAIEQTLGPRSPAADMESISGRSNRSGRSQKSNRSTRSSRSRQSARSQRSSEVGKSSRSTRRSSSKKSMSTRAEANEGTPRSRRTSTSTAQATANVANDEFKDSSEERLTPRTLEYDLRRLEVTVEEIVPDETDQMTTSTITASTACASRSTLSSYRPPSRRSKAKRVTVVVPPGKLGVVLADRHDGKGTVVSDVRSSSAMVGMLHPGDKVVAIDGEDVRGMFVSQVTSLMAAKSGQERRLTIVTAKHFDDLDETKEEDYND